MKHLLVAPLFTVGTVLPASAVTYHDPDPPMEENLNFYGSGVENWEEQRFVQFTMADAHLYHHWAQLHHDPDNAMPLEVTSGFDPAAIMLDDVIPDRQISLYDVMRDRANLQNYVVMNREGQILGEDYWNGTDQNTLNHLMSASKPFCSMAAFISKEQGLISLDDPVGKYISEVQGTEWADIPLRYFSDMTVGAPVFRRTVKDTTGPLSVLARTGLGTAPCRRR